MHIKVSVAVSQVPLQVANRWLRAAPRPALVRASVILLPEGRQPRRAEHGLDLPPPHSRHSLRARDTSQELEEQEGAAVLQFALEYEHVSK